MQLTGKQIEHQRRTLAKIFQTLRRGIDRKVFDQTYCQLFRENMGLFQDYGLIGESYDLCEDVCNFPVELGECSEFEACRKLAHCFIGHMDLSRSRRVQAHMAFFSACESEADPLLVGHARMAQGIHCIQQGQAEKSLDFFARAREAFQDANNALYMLKCEILVIMAWRILDQHQRAYDYCHKQIEQAQSLGAKAAAPLLLLYSVAAGHNIYKGRRYEAQRYSWQAVRLSNSLPPSKASGFAYFQHARALHSLGKISNAIAYLEKADTVLRIYDPLARIANLMLLFQCYRAQQNWQAAEKLFRQLIDSPLSEYFWADLAELLEEGIGFFLDIFDTAQARTIVELYRSHADRHDELASRNDRIVEFARRILDLETRLEQAECLGYGQEAVAIIDKVGRRVVLRTANRIRQRKFAKAPATEVILDALIASNRKREPLVAKASLRAKWQTYNENTLGRSPEDLGKTLRRNLDALKAMGLIESEGKGLACQISFARNGQVLLLEKATEAVHLPSQVTRVVSAHY